MRGFERDLLDAHRFLREGLADAETLLALVRGIPDGAYARYPRLNRGAVVGAVVGAVEAFVSGVEDTRLDESS